MTERVRSLLSENPVFDGHNDLPWALRNRVRYDTDGGDFGALDIGIDQTAAGLHTDIPRLRRGGVGAQFWSVFVPCTLEGGAAVTATLEQIDTVRRIVQRYPDDLALAMTADEVERARLSGRVASLIGLEGGHCIDGSLGTLRMLYDLGARYLTLTHVRNTPWADSATDHPGTDGLSAFGHEVVRECNRLGVLVDLSHVADTTMHAALDTSTAPAFFSHSSARALCGHARNVPDDVLTRTRDTFGIVMVTFVPGFLNEECRVWIDALIAEEERLARHLAAEAGPGFRRAQLAWVADNPRPPCTVADVADHIEYVRAVAGVDHVGLGGDFDGMSVTPDGLEGVDGYPALLAELIGRNWSDADLAKLTWHNAIRVLRDTEAAARDAQRVRGPSMATMADLDSGRRAPVEAATRTVPPELRGVDPALERFNLTDIADALADQSYEHRWILDPTTGEVHIYSDDSGLDGGAGDYDLEDMPTDWTTIASIPSYTWYQDMVDFAELVSDDRIARLLDVALNGKGAFRRFKDVVFADPELGPAWNAFRDLRGRRRAVEWLCDNDLVGQATADAYVRTHDDPHVP